MVFRFWILAVMMTVTVAVRAQELAMPQLLAMLDWPHKQMDTTLVKQGYLLMQKDIDSSATLYQYSHLDRQEEAPTTVRSLMYMDVRVNNIKSRLITYRTYNKEEYGSIASWLLANNYHSQNNFDFGNEKHTVYSNGTQTIRLKVITTALKDGRTFVAYEVEVGK